MHPTPRVVDGNRSRHRWVQIRWGSPASAAKRCSTPPIPQPFGERHVRRCASQGRSAPGFRVGYGSKIILFGARTGLDGIGGVSVWRATPRRRRIGAGRKKLPSVQVGDPFMEKVLIGAVWNSMRRPGGGHSGLGGAGLSCATSVASAGDGGMKDRTRQGPCAANMTPPRCCPANRRSGCVRS